MQHEKSCGAIVYRKSHGNTEILLIKHINSGHWSFPKGHMENGETEIETAIREIKEETSVNVMIDPTFRETVSYFPKRDTQKTVVYFIARAKNYDFVPQEEEIAEIRWVDIGYASTILTYENDQEHCQQSKSGDQRILNALQKNQNRFRFYATRTGSGFLGQYHTNFMQCFL